VAANWNQELEDKLNGAFENTPASVVNWINWTPYPSRRQTRLNLDMKLGEIEYKDHDATHFD